jgi:CheY-like chemotaxis protein
VSPSKLTVLLVCKDPVRRDRIRARLRSEGHGIVTIDLNLTSKMELDRIACGTDVAIFDLTDRDRRVWDGLRRTTRLRRFDGFPVLVICSSQADHGARFERDVEKLGGRWVYDEAV